MLKRVLYLLALLVLAGGIFVGAMFLTSPGSQTFTAWAADGLLTPVFLPYLKYSPAETPTPSPTPTQPPGPIPTPIFQGSWPGIFGVEIGVNNGLNEAPSLRANWTRLNGIFWSDIEPNPGDRNWTAAAGVEKQLLYAAQNNKEMILIVRSTPIWAQKVAGSYCGPIRADQFGAFAKFMVDLVNRYSNPPYAVKYWELGNEPDVDPALVGDHSVFGCWGDRTDEYYGGGYYAEMLKVVYPAIKAADPKAQVMVGGLLLGCDPRPATTCATYNGDKPPRFLEGILRNGGAPYFDGVSFHSFDAYTGVLGQYTTPTWNSSWNTTGPLIISKARFLKEVLSAYGASNKYLLNTETSLTIYSKTCGDTCQKAKAYYITQVYAATLAEGVRMSNYYSLTSGWRHTSLLSSTGTFFPAYYAFNIAAQKLDRASFVRRLDQDLPGVKGYEFKYDKHFLWVLWSLDGADHTVTLPGSLISLVDPLGNSVTTQNNTFKATLTPLYLDWSP